MFFYLMFLLLRKTGVVKTCRKSNFLKKKVWRNALALRIKKIQVIFRKTFILALLSSFLLNCFVQEIKGFYQGSLGNEVDFRDIMNVSPNILAKTENFKKLRHGFVDERALITTTLISFCHWKSLVPVCLQKKRPESAFLTLIVNYRKIVQKSKLCHSKQQ